MFHNVAAWNSEYCSQHNTNITDLNFLQGWQIHKIKAMPANDTRNTGMAN